MILLICSYGLLLPIMIIIIKTVILLWRLLYNNTRILNYFKNMLKPHKIPVGMVPTSCVLPDIVLHVRAKRTDRNTMKIA